MNVRNGLMLLAALAALAGCNREKEGETSLLLAGLEDDEEAFAATLDASEAAIAGPAAFAPGSSAASFAGCSGTVTGTNMIAVCSRNVPGNRTIDWSCTGDNGGTIAGSASIATTVLDDTDCPNVTIQHQVAFDRTATFGVHEANLAGTSTVTLTLDSANRSAQRTVVANLTRQVTRDGELVRDQELTGSRVADLEANGAGPDDDTRTVNGSAQVEFNLAEATLDLTATDLLWQRGCCHPIGGTLGYEFGGSRSGAGTVAFGPACGDATDDGEPLDLRPCPQFGP